MLEGTVKWFNEKKGFGFIESEHKDYFVYFKEIKMDGYKKLAEGQKVSFEAALSDKGPLAKNVTVL